MGLTLDEAGGGPALLSFMRDLLSAAAASTAPSAARLLSPAVALMRQYPEIAADLDGAAVLSMLVDYGQEALASGLAADMDGECQVQLSIYMRVNARCTCMHALLIASVQLLTMSVTWMASVRYSSTLCPHATHCAVCMHVHRACMCASLCRS
jgi:hypothetical protein